eukprot:GHVS01063217.1.p1 GENE.GHVS01063217.1~~GHVS01063217.1.p1  ORF type:complete len:246 (-),score=41.71 GHVS01063217.1:276-1013(-)
MFCCVCTLVYYVLLKVDESRRQSLSTPTGLTQCFGKGVGHPLFLQERLRPGLMLRRTLSGASAMEPRPSAALPRAKGDDATEVAAPNNESPNNVSPNNESPNNVSPTEQLTFGGGVPTPQETCVGSQRSSRHHHHHQVVAWKEGKHRRPPATPLKPHYLRMRPPKLSGKALGKLQPQQQQPRSVPSTRPPPLWIDQSYVPPPFGEAPVDSSRVVAYMRSRGHRGLVSRRISDCATNRSYEPSPLI